MGAVIQHAIIAKHGSSAGQFGDGPAPGGDASGGKPPGKSTTGLHRNARLATPLRV
jgi:hypothetical protein